VRQILVVYININRVVSAVFLHSDHTNHSVVFQFVDSNNGVIPTKFFKFFISQVFRGGYGGVMVRLSLGGERCK
jgi:hypothetical protein